VIPLNAAGKYFLLSEECLFALLFQISYVSWKKISPKYIKLHEKHPPSTV
jgi:hypothetical protein